MSDTLSGFGLAPTEGEGAAQGIRDYARHAGLPQLNQGNLQRTELASIQEDPRLRRAQIASLDQFGEFAKGALTPADKARLQQEQQQLALQERGQRESLLQGAARRGQSGSGFTQASLLANQQGTATRANDSALALEQMLQDRQLAATSQQAGLAGNIRASELAQRTARAQAQDIINRFNLENRQNRQQQQFENRMTRYNTALGANQQALSAQNARGGRFAGLVGAGISAAATGGVAPAVTAAVKPPAGSTIPGGGQWT